MDYESRETELHTLAIRVMRAQIRRSQDIRGELYVDRGVGPCTGSGARLHAGSVSPAHGGVALVDVVDDTQGGEV